MEIADHERFNHPETLPDQYTEIPVIEFENTSIVEINPPDVSPEDSWETLLLGGVAAGSIAEFMENHLRQFGRDSTDRIAEDAKRGVPGKVSRRNFLRYASAAGLSLAAAAALSPKGFTEYLKARGDISGLIEKETERYFFHILGGTFAGEYAAREFFHSHPESMTTVPIEVAHTEPDGDTVITLEAFRGREELMGKAQVVLLREKAPFITLPGVVLEGVIAAKPEYIADRIHKEHGVDAAVSSASWYSHYGLTYAEALGFPRQTIEDASAAEVFQLQKTYNANPPGGEKNRWKEWGGVTSFIASSRTPEFNHELVRFGILSDRPENDTRGYKGAKSEHVIYTYSADGWDYKIADCVEIQQLIESNASYEWTSWKPLLVLSEETQTSLDAVDGHENIVNIGASFIAKDSQNKLVSGILSGDLTVLARPSEIWNMAYETIAREGYKLEHVFLTDAGGSAGVAIPGVCESQFTEGYGSCQTVGRSVVGNQIAESSVLGPSGGVVQAWLEKYSPYHTLGIIQLHIKPEDIFRLPNYYQ